MSYAMAKPSRPTTTPAAPVFLTDLEEQDVHARKKRGPVVPKGLMLSRSSVIDEMASQQRRVQLTPLPSSSSAPTLQPAAGVVRRTSGSPQKLPPVGSPPTPPCRSTTAGEASGSSGRTSPAAAPAPSSEILASLQSHLHMAMTAEQKALHERARQTHRRHKPLANKAWREERFDDCVEHLNKVVEVDARCDVLHRYRGLCHSRQGRHEAALNDARRAVRLNTRSSANFYVEGKLLHEQQQLEEAGVSYLAAMRLGATGADLGEARYEHLLDTVRRKRSYANVVRPVVGVPPAPAFEKLDARDARGRVRPHGSIFDPRKRLDDGRAARAALPEAPVLVLRRQGMRELGLEWEEPYDGGDEIYLYKLEVADYDVKWQERTNDFFEGYRPWRVAHQGPAAVRRFELKVGHTGGALKPTNWYKMRLSCANGTGDSEAHEVVFETAKLSGGGARDPEAPPQPWLRADVPDIMAAHMEATGGGMYDFVQQLVEALTPHVADIRRIFRATATSGMGAGSAGTTLDGGMFAKLARDCGLVEGKAEPRLAAANKKAGLKPISSGELDLLYQRATVKAGSLQSRSMKFQDTDELSKMAAEAAADVSAAVVSSDPASPGGPSPLRRSSPGKDDDADAEGMQTSEFAGALVRLAWCCMPQPVAKGGTPEGIGPRMTRLLGGVIVPALDHVLNAVDPIAETIESGRVRAVLEHYDKDMRAIFKSYSAADQSADARLAADSVNLAELMYMFKEGRLIDDNLTNGKVATIFSLVNSQSDECEGGDDDTAELQYDEFMQVVARCCNAKIPVENRGGEGFEYTLQAWLHYMIVPVYKQLIKDKARGIASKTL